MNKKPISPMTSCREAVRTAASYPLSAHDHLVKPIALGQYGYMNGKKGKNIRMCEPKTHRIAVECL